jgi:GDP-6-deoxy-D-talose 4-dehydrogenase
MYKRVLLTGARGFTGRHLMRLLAQQGHAVLACDPRSPESLETSAEWVECDLCGDLSPLRAAMLRFKPTHVLHMAAVSNVVAEDPLQYYRVNVLGTENLLKILSETAAGLVKVVLASSANIYGDTAASPVRESHAPAPISHYAVSKAAMEHIAATWFRRLPILLTRPFNYTGPGQSNHFLVPKIVEHFRLARDVISLGNVDVSRDISDIRYVCDIYSRLLDVPQTSIAVNICSGRSISIAEILSALSEISGRTIAVRVDPTLVRANEIRTLCGSTELLQQLVGRLAPPPFRETLLSMYVADGQS